MSDSLCTDAPVSTFPGGYRPVPAHLALAIVLTLGVFSHSVLIWLDGGAIFLLRIFSLQHQEYGCVSLV